MPATASSTIGRSLVALGDGGRSSRIFEKREGGNLRWVRCCVGATGNQSVCCVLVLLKFSAVCIASGIQCCVGANEIQCCVGANGIQCCVSQ